MKRDVNFIKYIKPQLKERERTDKAISRQTRYDKIKPIITDQGITIDDVNVIVGIMRRIRGTS